MSCYFHEGPCELLEANDRAELWKHSNSIFQWWEVYDKTNFKFIEFKRKHKAVDHYIEISKGCVKR